MRAWSPSPDVLRALEGAYLVCSHFELQDLLEGKRGSGASLSLRFPLESNNGHPHPVEPLLSPWGPIPWET